MASGRVPKVMNTDGRDTLSGSPRVDDLLPDSSRGVPETQTAADSDRIPGQRRPRGPTRRPGEQGNAKDGILSRLLDDRGRLFGKVNIVDIIVLVVIVAIVVFAAVRLTGGGTVATVPVKVTFLDKRVDASFVPAAEATQTIRDAAGNVIGVVQSVDITPSVEELVTPDGQLKTFASSTKKDVAYVVMCQGTITDSTAHIGSLAARVGADVRIVGPGYEAQTTISAVVWGG